MKLYLAGPMRGYPESNFPAFDAGAAELRSAGFIVFSPADKDRETCFLTGRTVEELTIRECLRVDMDWICDHAQGIALLPGWEHSTGANAERALGIALGIPVLEITEWLDLAGRTHAASTTPTDA